MTDSKKKRLEQKILELALEKGITPEVLRANIDAVKHPTVHPVRDLSDHVKDNKLNIGVISDTCLNSKHTRPDILHTAYAFFKQLDVPYVLHCGNITDGYLKSRTHAEHILFQDYLGMLEYIKEVYPNIGVPTYFIGGRNELTFFKRVVAKEKMVRGKKVRYKEKTNVCHDLEKQREDLVFLGWNDARVRVAPKVTIALASPESGSRKPYTVSHPMQKVLESYGGGEKPRIQLLGYYNQRWSGEHLGVDAHMVGTTQNQPPGGYSRGEPSHNLVVTVLQLRFRKDGSLAENGSTAIELPFYE